MTEFHDIRSALEYTVGTLIPNRRTFIVGILGPKEAKQNYACSVQVVAESMVFGNDERGLTLNLPFDPTCRQEKRRLKRFRATAISARFTEYDFGGIPCYAMQFGTDVDLALKVLQAVLKDAWGYPASTAFECHVSDEGPE